MTTNTKPTEDGVIFFITEGEPAPKGGGKPQIYEFNAFLDRKEGSRFFTALLEKYDKEPKPNEDVEIVFAELLIEGVVQMNNAPDRMLTETKIIGRRIVNS